ncbi:hypothetical protein [Allohahella marinimesophila]|uniref:Uncharacterized protein n=1 Tax=Allohahella marinimesophila TaxID=1054972 RepID=A0ABP7NZ44_9GAMM
MQAVSSVLHQPGRIVSVIVIAALLTLSTHGPVVLAKDSTDVGSSRDADPDPIDFSRFDIYASEGFVLKHQYIADTGDAITIIDTSEPSLTREIQSNGAVTSYETLESDSGHITLEEVTRYDALGECVSRHKTRYQWLSVFPEVAHKGDQLQRIASVTDFAHERPCGKADSQQPVVNSAIKVAYTVLGRTEYTNGTVRLDDCVKLTEQAPDYSGIATVCAGVGTAYRLRTGTTFGRNERQLIAVDQPPGSPLSSR